MSKNFAAPAANQAGRVSFPTNSGPAKPPEVVALLATIGQRLQEGKPEEALAQIRKAKSDSPWIRNALGVCHLRQGNPAGALDVFRGLVLESDGLSMRPGAATVFKTNFAVALLGTNNLSGFFGALSDLHGESHPAAARLQDALQRWKAGLSLWQKFMYYLGGEPSTPLTLDFPPGDLE